MAFKMRKPESQYRTRYLSPSTNDILLSVNLFDIVPPVKRKGAEMYCYCPLHDDQHASFRVKVKDGVQCWYCDVCAKGGNVFGLFQHLYGIGITDAMKLVAVMGGWENP